MGQGDMHLLFQQMGEVLTGVQGLHDTIHLRQAQAEQLHDLLRSDLATLRRDQRNLEEKMTYVVFMAQHELEALRHSSMENAQSVERLILTTDALRRPVKEIVALRSRISALLVVGGVLTSCMLWLVEPVYRWFIDINLLRR